MFIFLFQGNADVLACNVNTDGVVVVLDTWNRDNANRGNVLDVTMDTTSYTASTTDGRITCQ